MTRRTIRIALVELTEERDDTDTIETTGAELDELSRVVRSPLINRLAKCPAPVDELARRVSK